MRRLSPLWLLASAAAPGALAGGKAFSIHDDILAYPQFEVAFPDEYILVSDAETRLLAKAKSVSQSRTPSPTPSVQSKGAGHDALQAPLSHADGHNTGQSWEASSPLSESSGTYEEMVLQGTRYLCHIPYVEAEDESATAGSEQKGTRSKAEREKELAQATDRGLELLQEMEGRCMYYVFGWWSYSFCYNNQVKQFHALPSGGGVPSYPPMEDPGTQSFVLGRFRRDDEEDDGDGEGDPAFDESKRSKTDITELQTKGDSRYLVQRLEGGTTCDLTGKERKVEVQFHCHPHSTDRIGWIKEVTTCSYLMVIYTPRLCNDVAFQPPQPEDMHTIDCQLIIASEEIPQWEARRAQRTTQRLVNAGTTQFPVVGDIEVGAKKLVGTEGRQIEKGRVASAGQERIEVVAMKENGEIQRLSVEELKKYNLNPEKVEALKKHLENLANGKDWKLEVVESNGERGFRGIVDTDGDDDGDGDINDHAERKATQQRRAKGHQGSGKKHDPPDGGPGEHNDEAYKEEL